MADLGAIAALGRFASGGGSSSPAPVAGGTAAPGGWADLVSRVRSAPIQRRPLVLTPYRPPAPPKQQTHGRSILGQLRDVVTGIPQGVGHLGKGLGVELYHDVKGPFTGFKGGWTEGSSPFTYELAHSFGRTLGDIRHPTHFAQASRNSTIVGKLLEDITNASIAASGASRVLGAGADVTAAGAPGLSERLGQAAAHTERVAKLGGKVAESPFLPARATASLARQGLDVLQERGLPALGEKFPSLAERHPTMFTPEGRPARLTTAEGVKGGTRYEAVQHRIFRKLEQTGITPDEAAAAYAVVTGQAHMIPMLRQALEPAMATLGRAEGIAEVPTPEALGVPAAVHEVLAPTRIEGAHLTPEAARIAEEYLANPAAHPRVGQAADVMRQSRTLNESLGQQTGAAWAPHLPEYSNSADVLDMVRERWINENRKVLTEIGKSLNPEIGVSPTVAGAQWFFDQGHATGAFPELDDSWSQLENSPESYAAAWRPRMEEAQRARETLLARGDEAGANRVPYLPSELQAAGVNAEYLPSGRPLSTVPKTARLTYAKTREGVLGDIRLSSEHGRGFDPRTGEYVGVETAAPYRLQDLGGQMGKEARNMVLRKAYRDVLGTHGQTVSDFLAPEEIQAIQADATQTAARRYPHNVDPETGALYGQGAFEAQRLTGQGLREAAAAHGLEPWAEKGSALGDIKPADINGDTRFMRAGLKQKLAAQWLTPKDLPIGLKQLESINKKFKGAVLPWSVRWQVGDALSNALLGWVAGDVDPLTLAKSMRDLRNASPEIKALIETHAPSSGLTYGEDLSLAPEDLQPEINWQNKGRSFREHPIKTLQQPGFKLNNFINRTERQAFTLEHLSRELDKAGMTLDEAAAAPHSPPVRTAMESAVRQADQALGSYDDMSPFEKRIVRNIFPFWSWIRNITRISFNLAVDHPLRAAWLMRVGQLGVDPNSDLPDYLRGSLNIPGVGRIDSNFLNAFADPTAQTILTPEGAMRSLSPGLKIAAAAGLGVDLNRSGLPLSRPPGTGRLDTLGRPTQTPLANRPSELGYYLSQQVPQLRVLTNLAPQVGVPGTHVTLGPVARYPQGTMITKGHGRNAAPLDTDPRILDALAGIGIPVPMQQGDVNSLVASAQKRQKAAARRKG